MLILRVAEEENHLDLWMHIPHESNKILLVRQIRTTAETANQCNIVPTPLIVFDNIGNKTLANTNVNLHLSKKVFGQFGLRLLLVGIDRPNDVDNIKDLLGLTNNIQMTNVKRVK
jgi:hypothetical protein